MKKTAKNGLIFLWFSIVILVSDLLTKYIIITRFKLHESIEILPVFNLTYVRNYGAAFSFLSDHNGWQKYFFIAIAIIISSILAYWLAQTPRNRTLLNLGYASIIGGALGNMLDRSYHGFVVDFLHVYWDIYHYPVFNVADIAVTLGATMLIIDYFKHPDSKEIDGK